MIPDQQLLLTQLMTLWAVLDPIRHLSLFMATTADLERAERQRAALISVILAFTVLVFFGLVGQFCCTRWVFRSCRSRSRVKSSCSCSACPSL